MHQNLKNYYQNIIVYDLLTKLHYKNIFEIPKITKINLNIGFKNANIEKKKLTNIIVLLKLITNQQPFLTKSNKNNIILKIKKGSIIGCKVTLRKKNIDLFLEKLILFILPEIKEIQYKLNQNILNFQIKNSLHFFELKTEFLKFKDIPPIDVSIHTNTKNSLDFFLLLNYYYLLKNKVK
jgi:large subunit ribosomal protein L5